ncbi:MAG: MFS transporter [Parvularculaceae bacterium]|nr:MFS transporter [Parvularculaceae bacterium]
MLRAVFSISALLLAAAILLAGNGLQGTLLAVRGNLEGFPTALIGALMSAYYAGFILGCRVNPAFIKSVGHIRTFLALASIASAATLMHPFFVNVLAWAVLRAITGFCFAGLIMIIESWINERATNANRGQILSVYRVIDLGATTAGNMLLATASPQGFELFALTSILISLALAPVALTRSDAPKPIATARLNIPKLFQVSPVAAIGAPLIGLGNAAFWSVGAVYAARLGYDKALIASFMSSVIIGAAVLQWPLGWISDRIDRRLVMIGSAICGVSAAIALARYGGVSPHLLLLLGATFGAFIIPMFGLTAAHANDHAEPGTAVETNGGLLLLNGCGSVVGATLGAVVMAKFGPAALFEYIAAVYGAFIIFCIIRVLITKPVPEEEKSPFSPVPKNAAPTVFEIGAEDEDEPKAGAPEAA